MKLDYSGNLSFDLSLSVGEGTDMTQKERDEFAKQAIEHRKTVTASVKASRKFLIAVGVLAPPKVKLRKPAKPACIPNAQG